MPYYAWSEINNGKQMYALGDEVPEDAASSEEEWQSWLEGTVVRDVPYPDMGTRKGKQSPLEFMREKAAKESDEVARLAQQLNTTPGQTLAPPPSSGVEEGTGPSEESQGLGQ